jgi:AraC-like DNA-binding protein
MNVAACGVCERPIRYCGSHSHDTWEIVLNLTGENCTRIGEQTYEIRAGDVMIIPPNTAHYGESEGYYTDIFLKVREIDFAEPCVVHDMDGSIQVLFQMINKVLLEKEFHYETIADQLLEVVCAYIKKAAQMNFRYPFVHKLKNTIYENIADIDFDLSKAIQETGFHPDYFRRCFKEELGKTPLEYLLWLRVRRGKMLMLQDTYSGVENVAEQCGFRDSFYFSSCFKKHVGLSPLQYRKKNYRAEGSS